MGQKIKTTRTTIGARMKFLCCILLFFSQGAFAAQTLYPFQDNNKKIRFEQLTTDLRCLVCQNQNLAESNASLAADLRTQIYQKIQHH